MNSKAVVLGAGGWGLALAKVLCENGHNVTVWSKIEAELEEIKTYRMRPSVLDGVHIPEEISLSSDLSVCADAEFIVIATAARFVRSTCESIRGIANENAIIVSVAKGLDTETNMTLSATVAECLPHNPVAILSGPSHAEEVGRSVPTALVAASKDKETAQRVADVFKSPAVRVYLSSDVVGVELGGVIKNVIAIAAGIIDGMGYGDNSKAAVMTRAIVEMARLGEKLGGKAQTFAGLTGMGDLIVTCTSMHSRNRRCGILIGKGVKTEDAVKEIGMTVEGAASAKTVYALAKQNGVEMPIVEAVYKVLYEDLPAQQVMFDLMHREVKAENEDVWF